MNFKFRTFKFGTFLSGYISSRPLRNRCSKKYFWKTTPVLGFVFGSSKVWSRNWDFAWPGINSAEIVPHFEVNLVHFFRIDGSMFFRKLNSGRSRMTGMIQWPWTLIYPFKVNQSIVYQIAHMVDFIILKWFYLSI